MADFTKIPNFLTNISDIVFESMEKYFVSLCLVTRSCFHCAIQSVKRIKYGTRQGVEELIIPSNYSRQTNDSRSERWRVLVSK